MGPFSTARRSCSAALLRSPVALLRPPAVLARPPAGRPPPPDRRLCSAALRVALTWCSASHLLVRHGSHVLPDRLPCTSRSPPRQRASSAQPRPTSPATSTSTGSLANWETKGVMVAALRDRRRRGRAPASASAAAADDDGEEQHLNPFLSDEAPSSSRVQFRNVASRARWVEEAGEAEVVDSKGKLWLTTGVTRGGKLYYNVEEIGFLAERGALVLLDDQDETIGLDKIYGKIAGGKYGCSWDAFQAYKHLKLLGYVVGRYGVPWTMKHSRTCEVTDSPKGMADTDHCSDRADGACSDITKFLKEMRLDGIYPSFQVQLPNSKFKKSSPGDPSFLLCLLRDKPPSRDELETVENKFEGVPLKFCHVDNGRVSFLSFDKVTLPCLP